MAYVCRLLEAEAAHQAVSVDSPAELFWRATLVQQLKGERPGAAEFMQFDQDSHTLVAKTAGSSLLTDVTKELKSKTRELRQGLYLRAF